MGGDERTFVFSEFPACAARDGAVAAVALRIGEMCNVELDFSKRFAPVYKVPAEFSGTGVPPVKSRARCACHLKLKHYLLLTVMGQSANIRRNWEGRLCLLAGFTSLFAL